MRDLGITVLVAFLIIVAGIRFSGYQSQLATEDQEPLGENSASVIDATKSGTAPTSTPASTSSEPAVKGTVITIPATGALASLEVKDQKAGNVVVLDSVSVPEGSYWVAVHEGTRTLGARLFSKGKTAGTVELLRSTTAGMSYTISLRKDNGDRTYSRATDLEVKDATGAPVQVVINAL